MDKKEWNFDDRMGVVRCESGAVADAVIFEEGHLIAAAPDLYEALEEIVFEWDGDPEDMHAARTAIAKARGEG